MKEPPMGSIVVDKRGSAWQKHPVGWAMAGSDGSWNYSWKELLKELHQDCIVYIPHEELLWDDEDE